MDLSVNAEGGGFDNESLNMGQIELSKIKFDELSEDDIDGVLLPKEL